MVALNSTLVCSNVFITESGAHVDNDFLGELVGAGSIPAEANVVFFPSLPPPSSEGTGHP